jgi:N-acetylmuramoyl-L-alanine amidase
MVTSSRRARRAAARFLTGTALVTVVATGLPAPAAVPAPPEVQTESVDLAALDGVGGPDAADGQRSAAAADGPVEEGWTATVKPSFPAQLVGFTWDGAPDGAVEVRRRSGDTWSEWYEVHADADEGPDAGSPEARPRTSAGPVWLGDGTDEVEVRVEHGRLDGLRMEAIRSIEHEAPAGGIAGAGALPGPPGIVSRAAWGAAGWATGNSGCGGGPSYAAPRFGVLHHTVNGNGYGADQSDDLLRGIQAFHQRTNGWCDIAYNFIVDRFGRVFEARGGGVDAGVMGGHTKGFNEGAIGVSLLGDHSQGGVTPAALAGVRALLTWKFAIHGIDAGASTIEVSGGSTKYPDGQVVGLPRLFGHRDVSLTSCPGGFAYPLLTGLRRDVQSAVVASRPDPLPRWRPESDKPAVRVLDAFGGVNPAGGAGPVGHAAHWSGFAIARGVAAGTRGRGYVLDGFGGVHPYGGAGAPRNTSYWPGQDLGRGIARSGSGRGWVLDAFGGLHPFGGAPRPRTSFYAAGWDIARGIAARPGGGGYVVDGFGGVHPFGGAPAVRANAYWAGWDIVRGIVTRPDGRGGYVLDGFGGVHPFGGAPRLRTTWRSAGDTARGIALYGSGSAGYVVDADGGLHPIGTAPPVRTSRTWTGRGLTRGVAVG